MATLHQPLVALPSRDLAHHRRLATTVLVAGGYVVSYILLDWLSYVQPVLKFGITPWNPQAGLTLAFLLVRGPRWLPVTALAAVLAEICVRGTPAPLSILLIASLIIAVGYSGLAVVLRAWGMKRPIATPGDAARLVAASIVATLAIGSAYVALFFAAGDLTADVARGGVARYWVGDVNGILTLTPLLLYRLEGANLWRNVWTRRWEVTAQLAVVLLTVWVIFGLAVTDELRFFYPLFVPVIWIALRWGVPGAVMATLTIQVALIITAQEQSHTPPLIDLQFLMLTLSGTALLLGAVVTERLKALRQMAEREAEQRTLLATVPDAVLTLDAAGRVHSANPAARDLFGDIAATAAPCVINELLPALHPLALEGRATVEACRLDGTVFQADTAWARLQAPANEGFLVTVRDATERQRAEAQLRERDTALARAMRFAVAGELASALAHELNQPITALVSYLGAAQILSAPIGVKDERLRTTLGKAAHEALRASEVLKRLRDFYRGGAFKQESLSIGSVCHAAAALFQERLRRARTLFVLRIPESIPTVQGDATQLEIVLHNLLANAIDAIAETNSPWRRIEVQAERSGGDIVLKVEDSGPGIAREVAKKLFEPFVTSKPDGMGLGLAISRSLLRARGGDLSCEASSRLGGACFVIRLPIEIAQEMRA